MFKFVDLFSGIGSFRLGFSFIGGECVFSSEIDERCIKTYSANFSESEKHIMARDITDVHAKEIPDHDVLLAGFPCQSFTPLGIADRGLRGLGTGFKDRAKGTLFFDVARILEAKKPKAFCLENVPGLTFHNKGDTFRTIMSTLKDDLGYQVHYKIINSRAWVPQKRRRIFIVGFKNRNDFEFGGIMQPSLISGVNVFSPDEIHGPVLSTILHPENGTEVAEPPYTLGEMATVNEKYILKDSTWQKHLQEMESEDSVVAFIPKAFWPNQVASTLLTSPRVLIYRVNGNPRRMTPRECSRIMGFDNPGESNWNIPVADSWAWQQFGNSIVVQVSKYVASCMLPWL